MSFEEMYPTLRTQAYFAVMRYDPLRKDKMQELISMAYVKYKKDIELLENNSMVLSGTETENIIDAYKIAISCSIWEIPNDYKDINTSEKIVKLMIPVDHF